MAADAQVARGVPRPSDAKPGRPAPWQGVDPSRRTQVTLRVVRAALEGAERGLRTEPASPLDELTGADAAATASLRDAAVLVVLFEEAGETRVVLTRRSTTLRRHRGEVAFPGGRIDPGETALDAALREADEEVGLDPGDVETVAWLRPIVTFASGSIIRPYVGVLDGRPHLEAHPVEVDRVFDVGLADLLDEGAFHEELWRRPSPRATTADGYVPILFFEVDGETVWGATARILTELCCLVTGVPLR